MPASTPVYGIPYPCPGEMIDSAVFADFANAVDAAMASVTSTAGEALDRPTAKAALVAGSHPFAAGVYETLPFDTELWDNDGILAAMPTSVFTVQTAGSYHVVAGGAIVDTGGAFDAGDFYLAINGFQAYGVRNTDPLGGNLQMRLSGMFDCVPGDTLSLMAYKHGAGTAGALLYSCAIRLINLP